MPKGARRMCGTGFRLACPPVKRSRIAAEVGDERVRAFMARCGKEKHDVPDHSEGDEIGSHTRRKTRTSTRVSQAAMRQAFARRGKFPAGPTSFALQIGMLDSAKRSCRKKSCGADRRSVELRALCNDSPQTPPGPEGSNGSGSASCAADHPKFLSSPPADSGRRTENGIE